MKMLDYHANALGTALRRVKSLSATAAIEHAVMTCKTVPIEVQRAVMAEVPAFSKSRNPDLLPELNLHGMDIVNEIVRLLETGGPANLDFVQEHARRRAAQHFPLEATLHAYRSGQKVLSRWLCDSVSAVSLTPELAQTVNVAVMNFSVEFVDAISTTFAGSYHSHALFLAETAVDQRSALLNLLLRGRDETDPTASRMFRDAGFLEERQIFCVVLARSVDPTEMLDLTRARRMVDAIEKSIGALAVRRIVDVHDNKVIMVAAAVSRDSGWTAPRVSLAREIRGQLNLVGNAALIGISNDVPLMLHVPKAYQEAETALCHATVSERVVLFGEISLRRLLIHCAAQDFHRMLPAWAPIFFRADDKSDGNLVATLRAYAKFDMNILKAADSLGVHPNTVYARLQRVFELSGLEPRSFNSLSDLLVVCDCARGINAG